MKAASFTKFTSNSSDSRSNSLLSSPIKVTTIPIIQTRLFEKIRIMHRVNALADAITVL